MRTFFTVFFQNILHKLLFLDFFQKFFGIFLLELLWDAYRKFPEMLSNIFLIGLPIVPLGDLSNLAYGVLSKVFSRVQPNLSCRISLEVCREILLKFNWKFFQEILWTFSKDSPKKNKKTYRESEVLSEILSEMLFSSSGL